MRTGELVSKKKYAPRNSKWSIDREPQAQPLISEVEKHLARVECAMHAVNDSECRDFYRALGVEPEVTA